MDAREMTKTQLAEQSGMGANNLSRIMSPDYGKQTISSLRRIAEALDVALVVRMVPFSHYLDWLSGIKRVEEGLNPSALAVPSFDDEEKLGVFDARTPSYFHAVYSRDVPATKNVTIPGAVGIDGNRPMTIIPFQVLNEDKRDMWKEKRA
jgi:transcriptional regulator with XRE-family HTH domain